MPDFFFKIKNKTKQTKQNIWETKHEASPDAVSNKTLCIQKKKKNPS